MLALAVAIAIATPDPAPSPLKEIVRVRSRALCTTLAERVAPAIAGLLKDDELIELGRKGFEKMAADGKAGRRMDDLGLENIIVALVHNLKTIDDILDAPAAFAADPKTDDERAAAAIKSKLLATEAQQKAVLNVVSATVESDAMADMDEGLADAPTATSGSSIAAAAPGSAGQPQSSLIEPGFSDMTFEVNAVSLPGESPYARSAAALAHMQRRDAAAESAAAQEVMMVAAQCTSH